MSILGDVDGDGHADYAVAGLRVPASPARATAERARYVECTSGQTGERLWTLEIPPPPPLGAKITFYSRTSDSVPNDLRDGTRLQPLHDVDGERISAEELTALDLASALALPCETRASCCPESGLAVVYSGKDRSPMCGVWGLPGTFRNVGLDVAGLPDVNGDGAPELVVSAKEGTFFFRFVTNEER